MQHAASAVVGGWMVSISIGSPGYGHAENPIGTEINGEHMEKPTVGKPQCQRNLERSPD